MRSNLQASLVSVVLVQRSLRDLLQRVSGEVDKKVHSHV